MMISLGVSVHANTGTSLVQNTWTPPTTTGTQWLNIYPRQENPENYVTSNEFTIGDMNVTNATIDINSPYTFVNDESCTNCKTHGNASDPSTDFATYNYSLSTTWTNLTLTFPPYLGVNTLYNHFQYVNGTWSSDVWANYDVNNMLTADISFFMITEVDTVADTFGYNQVIGLGSPGNVYTPAGSNLVETMYYQNQLNMKFVSIDYSWKSQSQVQLGQDYASLRPGYSTGSSTIFDASTDVYSQGW